MNNVMQLKRFREEVLLKMDKSEKDKKFNEFVKDLDKLDLKGDKFPYELDKIRGRN
jgi:hypothetical protein